MPAVSVSLTPEAHAVFMQWPKNAGLSSRSAQTSRCILVEGIHRGRIKQLELDVEVLNDEVALLEKLLDRMGSVDE